MATVNFSVPDDVKDAFNKAFKGENKSAILTRLMRDAIEERKRQKRRVTAINEILSLRSKSNVVTDSEIRKARWFIRDIEEEKDVTSAVDILIGVGRNNIELIQPPHWIAEIISVLSRLQPDITNDAIDLLDVMEIPIRAESSVYKLASQIAIEMNHHLFDTLYHALALHVNATLLTADHRYFRKSVNHGSICMLADFDLDT